MQRDEILKVGKSAGIFRRSGHGLRIGLPFDDARSLVIKEEEGLIARVINVRNAKWATDRSSKLILAELGFALRAEYEEVLGIEEIVAHEFPQIAVVGIRSGLGSHVQHRACCMAELRRVVAGLYSEFP